MIELPNSGKDHWNFTTVAVKTALEYILPLAGPRKQLVFIADGSTKQVINLIFYYIFSNVDKQNWNPSVWEGLSEVISDLKRTNPLASEIDSVSLHRSPAQHGKG